MSFLDLLFKRKLQENDPVQKELDYNGIAIDIEWPAGSIRKYPDMEKHMKYNYGYIRNTDSEDSEEIDIYYSGDPDPSLTVFKLKQLGFAEESTKDSPKTNYKFDEWKYMLGFKTRLDAAKAYVESMPPCAFGGIVDEYSLDEFKTIINKNKKETSSSSK